MNPATAVNNFGKSISHFNYDQFLASQMQLNRSRPKRILLIEDDPDMSSLLQHALGNKYSCRIDIAADPFEAMNMMTEKFYNLIILDWNLPAFDGGQTLMKAEQVMALEPMLPGQWDSQEVPVVVLSASSKTKCPLQKSKHFHYAGFVSKAQPLKKILHLLADFIEDHATSRNWAS